jgi:hypothetical protein
MDFRFVPPDLRKLDETSAELVACSVWEDGRPLGGLAGLLDWRLAGKLSALARDTFLVGSLGEVLFLPGRPRLPFDKVIVVGLGRRDAFDDDAFRTAVKRFVATLEGLHVRRAVVELPGRGHDAIAPERAAELVLPEIARLSNPDAWTLVEPPETQKRIAQRTQDERRRTLHAAHAEPRS